jgi:hypothetical protein
MKVVKLRGTMGGSGKSSARHQRIADLARQVDADPSSIGALSTGEACAAALLLGRLDLLEAPYTHPLDALERIGPDWEKAVRDLHSKDWRNLFPMTKTKRRRTEAQIIEEEIAAGMRKAEGECIRRGWMRRARDGRLEITEKGKGQIFKIIDEYTNQTRH